MYLYYQQYKNKCLRDLALGEAKRLGTLVLYAKALLSVLVCNTMYLSYSKLRPLLCCQVHFT